jgi:hypothetical protein
LVLYRDQEHYVDVWYRPLWDWACDLLKDPCLGLHLVFDAQQLYKYNGQDFVHFLMSHGWPMPSGIVKYVCAIKFECFNNVNVCFVVILAEG